MWKLSVLLCGLSILPPCSWTLLCQNIHLRGREVMGVHIRCILTQNAPSPLVYKWSRYQGLGFLLRTQLIKTSILCFRSVILCSPLVWSPSLPAWVPAKRGRYSQRTARGVFSPFPFSYRREGKFEEKNAFVSPIQMNFLWLTGKQEVMRWSLCQRGFWQMRKCFTLWSLLGHLGPVLLYVIFSADKQGAVKNECEATSIKNRHGLG